MLVDQCLQVCATDGHLVGFRAPPKVPSPVSATVCDIVSVVVQSYPVISSLCLTTILSLFLVLGIPLRYDSTIKFFRCELLLVSS